MKLVNEKTGQHRSVSFGGALAGSFFFGPLYLLFKGVWTWALLVLAINFVLALIHPALVVLAWLVWAAAASTMVESFYHQRGFTDDGYFMPREQQWVILLVIIGIGLQFILTHIPASEALVIYVFPSLVGLVVGALVVAVARRGGRGLIVSAVFGAVAGAGAWYVTLFTTVVMMLPMG